MPPTHPMIDSFRAIETPEGVSLTLAIAGLIPRILAWTIDFIIRLVLFATFAAIFSFFGTVGTALNLIIIFLLEWLYPVYFEVLHQGATPGKKRLQLTVVNDNGTPVSFAASTIRNLLRTIDFLPFLYGFGIVSILFNAHFKRLGDLAAGTLVIYKNTPLGAKNIPARKPMAPIFGLSLDEQRAMIEFAERAPHLTEERKKELADILTPLLEEKHNSRTEQIYAYANWLLGKR